MKRSSVARKVVISLVIITAVLCIASVVWWNWSETNHRKDVLYFACQQDTNEALNSPSAVKYQPIKTIKYKSLGNGVYYEKYYVDVQNSSGAWVHTTYECTESYENEGFISYYELISLTHN